VGGWRGQPSRCPAGPDPAELLPTVCYMREGLIAPEFASVDPGLAEKFRSRRWWIRIAGSPGPRGRVRGPGSQGRNLELPAGLLGQATRWRRTATGRLDMRGDSHPVPGILLTKADDASHSVMQKARQNARRAA
jgi:hypothetical protein